MMVVIMVVMMLVMMMVVVVLLLLLVVLMLLVVVEWGVLSISAPKEMVLAVSRGSWCPSAISNRELVSL